MKTDTAGNPIVMPDEAWTGPEMPIDFDMTDHDRAWRKGVDAKLDRILELLDKPKAAKVERPAKFFDEFWKAYPKERKSDKKKCLQIWKRRNLDHMAMVIVADVILRKKEHAKWIDGFSPGPARYLNGDLWTDPIVKANTQPVNVPNEIGALVRFAKKRGIKHPEGKVGEPPHEFRARVIREVAGDVE